MPKLITVTLFAVIFTIVESSKLYGQEGGQNLIRIAEFGELIDSVNVWGDVNRPGRYLVPEGTNIPDLISYSLGYNTLRGREAELDWSQVSLEIKVSRLNRDRQEIEVVYFRYRYHDHEPVEMFDFILQNNDIVTLQLRRRPSVRDYVALIGTTLGAVGTTIVLLERLSRD